MQQGKRKCSNIVCESLLRHVGLFPILIVGSGESQSLLVSDNCLDKDLPCMVMGSIHSSGLYRLFTTEKTPHLINVFSVELALKSNESFKKFHFKSRLLCTDGLSTLRIKSHDGSTV